MTSNILAKDSESENISLVKKKRCHRKNQGR